MAGPRQPFRDAASIKVEVAFVNNWNDTSLTWVDLTDRVRISGGISFSHGRNDEYTEVTPGQFSIVFNNFDRYLDSSFSGSPYYPYVDWARPIRITCYYLGVTYVTFTGLVEEWELDWTPGGDAICTATGIDTLGALALYQVAAFGSISTTAQARLAELCNQAGIPGANQNFMAGSYSLLGQTYAKTDLLSACQEIAAGQTQVFYVTRGGVLTTKGLFAATTSNQGTFGENAGELHGARMLAPAIGAPYDASLVILQSAAPTGGNASPAVSAAVPTTPGPGGGGPAATKTRYGTRVYSRNIAATSSAQAQAAATALAAAISTRQGPRIKQVTVYPMRDPVNLWPKVLATDFGTNFTFKYSAPGGGPRFTQDSVVRSIAMSITDQNWTVTWQTSKL